jgi:hypothetical protein
MPLTHPTQWRMHQTTCTKLRFGCIFGDPKRMADKPFNITYRAVDKGDLVLINGDQVTKIVAKKVESGWQITFHLSDGTEFTPARATEWAEKFVADNFPDSQRAQVKKQ